MWLFFTSQLRIFAREELETVKIFAVPLLSNVYVFIIHINMKENLISYYDPLKMCPWVFLQATLNCSHFLFPASFEVTVPKKHLLAIRGRPAVLGCEFTPDPDLSSLVVTWQRQEDARVVHSFYYQQDQLDRQSLKYHNRTSLYISELRKGNASLRISAVRPKDAGWYLCVVSNAKGTGRALMQVTYGGKREHQENVLCSVSTFQELPASFPVTEK